MFQYFWVSSRMKTEIMEAQQQTFFLTDWNFPNAKFENILRVSEEV